MTIEDIENICDGFPAVTKDIKWEEHLCFNVGAKMFIITSPDEFPPRATFKVTPDEYTELVARDGFTPASHLSRYHWVTVNDISLLSYKQWEFYARQSYDLVVSKLPNKLKASLGLS